MVVEGQELLGYHGRGRERRMMDSLWRNSSEHGMHRRELLKTGIGFASGVGLLSASGQLLGDETAKASTIDAYPDKLSYEPGEQVSLHVSAEAPKYSVEVARVGAKREVVWAKEDVSGESHPVPEDASTHGCRWPSSLTIPIEKAWKSGYYSVTLKAAGNNGDPSQAEAFFVVRSAQPGKQSRILLQLCTNTYNAYNNWGGACLYESGPLPLHGARVSFARPIARGFLTKPEGELSNWAPFAGWHNWERLFVEWAEGAGYKIDYAVNADLEERPELMDAYRLVLSVGHDEYWSAPMRDTLEKFIANGGNVAFFSGNVCYWQVRLEDDGKAMVCYKFRYEEDPYFKDQRYGQITSHWSNRLIERPENHLTGVSFNYGGYHRFGSVPRGAGGYTIHQPKHWIFEGTALQWGDLLGAEHQVVGYECDGCEFTCQDGQPVPTGRDGTPENFQILASAPARLWDSDLEPTSKSLFGDLDHQDRFTHGAATMGLYTRGGTVFTTGCTEWCRGLGGLNGGDRAVQRITRNVLDRLSV